MRNSIIKNWGVTLAGLVGLAVTTIVWLDAGNAYARGNAQPASTSRGGASHQSVLKISHRDRLPISKTVTIARNKSMLVELPRELRDVIVSNPEIVDAVVQSSNRVYLIGKKNGQANAFFFDVHGERIITLEIQVEQDTRPLDELLARLIPGSNIKTETLNETLILTGSVRNPVDSNRASDLASRFAVTDTPQAGKKEPLKVINLIAVEAEEQVMLRVTVAEVQRSLLKQFGVNLGAAINSGNFSTQLLTENALPITAAAGLGVLPVTGIDLTGTTTGNPLRLYNNGPGGVNSFGNNGVTNTWTSGGNRVQNAIRALERTGLVKTLAEPNLTAVSGEAAKFLAGGEYPVPVVDTNGALSVTYKEFGVGLAFTPIVMSEGRISLKIETEVSELSNAGAVTLSNISIPALKKRQAKSTVELPSGGTIALAGLLSQDTRQNIDGFPGLKDVPILGTLFRSRDFQKQETELVVIVTPYIVRATSRKNVSKPTDGLHAATDAKANFLGHLNRIYGKSTTVPTTGLKDGVGFIVE
ncbi:MAG TPA: type II and III secretion system protein family protein [Pirellulales bacterium]|nr:type II and III secretion system protein family protein [Pirellulales bacterium]